MVVFITSCEKETEIQLNNPSMDLNKGQFADSDMTIEDVENFQQTNNDQKKSGTSEVSGKTTDGPVDFYLNNEEFESMNCSSGETEDFEEARMGGSVVGFKSPLDEFFDNSVFSPGEIIPGVYFDTKLDQGSLDDLTIRDFSHISGESKRLTANFQSDDLQINFTEGNVYFASMKLYNTYSDGNIVVRVFGNSGLIGTMNVWSPSNYGAFVGIRSSEVITQITFDNASNGFERIDDFSFGTSCDADGDGCFDEEDSHPNSNLSEYISIDGCNTYAENVLVNCGTTMMDEIDGLIAEINAQYDGENYDDLHKDFTRKLAQLTYHWRKDRLITRRERSSMSSCAWRSDIPYFDQD